MGSFFQLHADLQLAVFDVLDFADRWAHRSALPLTAHIVPRCYSFTLGCLRLALLCPTWPEASTVLKAVAASPLTPPVMVLRRGRLACVSRAFRQFCTKHGTRLVVPIEGWEDYLEGVGRGRLLPYHAATLRAAYVRFEVRRACVSDADGCLLVVREPHHQ